MAISGFGRNKDGVGTTPSASGRATGQSGAGMSGALTAFIDQGSEFEGKLSFKDTVRIDGTFNGEISSENTLIVGETGQISAKITSVSIVISGYVEGNIVATRQVILHKSAVVNGDIESPSLTVEEGAQLNGAVLMSPSSPTTEKKSSVSPIRDGDTKQADGAPYSP